MFCTAIVQLPSSNIWDPNLYIPFYTKERDLMITDWRGKVVPFVAISERMIGTEQDEDDISDIRVLCSKNSEETDQ